MRVVAMDEHRRDVRLARGSRSAGAAALFVVVGLLAGRASPARADEAEAKRIFERRCTACHTFGKGIKVGPDLKGVTERRQRAWLLRFVRSSQKVIDSGDATAVALFQQFKQQRMPDWGDLSDEQIGSILDWLAANGPERKPADERLAELATPAEVEAGRALFHGGTALASGDLACASCHAVRDGAEVTGGSLGPDLTSAFPRYRDRAMTLFLREPCFDRVVGAAAGVFLLPGESFAIKAYLRQVSLSSGRGQGRGGDAVAGALAAGKPVAWTPPPTGGAPVRVGRAVRTPSPRDRALFLAFPLAAVLVLVLGMGVRHGLARRDRSRLRERARAARRQFAGSPAWRAGLIAIAIGHVAILLVPDAVLAWNRIPVRLYLLEGTGLVFGLVLLAGWGRLMWRHLARTASSRAERLGEIADCAFLSLVFAAIASGLAAAALHRWGSSWAAGTLAPYLASLARGEPATALVGQMPFLVQLHVLSLFTLIAALPFTSLALIPIEVVERGLGVVTRPLAAAAGAVRARLTRLSPARWIWPEEDLIPEPAALGSPAAAKVDPADPVATGAIQAELARAPRDGDGPRSTP